MSDIAKYAASDGNLRDCLGMTPLHILACSSVHDLELYRVIVEKNPTNLITEDRWGALPILHLFWGAAPSEIIQFFLASYQSLFPGHVFNWTMMVETMGRFNTSKESIKYMLRVKQMHFPDQLLDWDHLLDAITNSVDILNQTTQSNQSQKGYNLLSCATCQRVWRLLPLKVGVRTSYR